jgi:hypothetical protein
MQQLCLERLYVNIFLRFYPETQSAKRISAVIRLRAGVRRLLLEAINLRQSNIEQNSVDDLELTTDIEQLREIMTSMHGRLIKIFDESPEFEYVKHKSVEVSEATARYLREGGVNVIRYQLDDFDIDSISDEMLSGINSRLNNEFGVNLIRDRF